MLDLHFLVFIIELSLLYLMGAESWEDPLI